MVKIEIIGNIGKDAVVKEINGKQQVSFNVASSRKFTKSNGEVVESTMWVSVLMPLERWRGVMPFLVKGQQVFLRGDVRVNCYQGDNGWQAGVTCNVDQLELVGGRREERQHGVAQGNEQMQRAAEMMGAAGFVPEN